MQASDRILLLNHYHILIKDGSGINWAYKKILIIQDKLLIFQPDQASEKDSSILENEQFKMELQYSDARLVTEENSKKSNLNMTGVPDIPDTDEDVIQIVDHKNKVIKLMTSKNEEDSEKFIRAINGAKAWSKYRQYCLENKIKPNKNFLDWIIKTTSHLSSLDEPLILNHSDIFDYEINELIAYSIIIFLKENILLKNLNFSNIEINKETQGLMLQILTVIKTYQLNYLGFSNCGIDLDIIRLFVPVISHHTHLQKLNFSNNRIDDKTLGFFSIIFKHTPTLNDIDLSFNQIQGKPLFFEEFLDSLQINLQKFRLNLENNLLTDESIYPIEVSVFFAQNIEIVELNLKQNRFSPQGYYRLFKQYKDCQNKSLFQLIIQPIPIHPIYLNDLFQEKPVQNIQIIRNNFQQDQKRPIHNPQDLEQVNEIGKKIRNISLKSKDISIEKLYELCYQIGNLQYQYPFKKLEELWDVLWDKINQALEYKDHYSIQKLQEGCKLVGLDISLIDLKLEDSMNRTKRIVSNMINVLNFNFPENQINDHLDLIIEECMELDLRGDLLDILLIIKEKRDDHIVHLMKSQWEEKDDLQVFEQKDIFYVLENDSEFEKIPTGLDFNPCNFNLLLHPNKVNYYELCKIQHDRIKDDLIYVKSALEKEEGNYYYTNCYNRCLFLIGDHVEKFFPEIWKAPRGDLKLNCSRLAIQYRNFNQRIDMHQLKDPRPQKPFKYKIFEDIQNYQIPANDQGVQNDMRKYIFLKSSPDFFKKNRKNKFEYQDSSNQNKKGQILRDISQENSQNSRNQNQKHQNNPQQSNATDVDILEYQNQKLPTSLRQHRNQQFVEEALALDTLFNSIQQYNTDTQLEDKHFLKIVKTYVERIILSRNDDNSFSNSSPSHPSSDSSIVLRYDPDELVDEAYLQLYRYQNRQIEDQSFCNIKLVFRILLILTLYTPPSEYLVEYVKSWIYSYFNHPEYGQFSRRCLKNIQNNCNPEFVIPYWIPSKMEILYRMQCQDKLQITINLLDGRQKRVEICEFGTFSDLMDRIYVSDFLNSFVDKYSFWVFRAQKNQEDQILYREECILEKLSMWEEQLEEPWEFSLILKRRIFQSALTTNLNSLEDYQLSSLYYQVKRDYLQKDRYQEFINQDNVCRNAATFLLIKIIEKNKSFDENISEETVMNKLKSLIPQKYLLHYNSQQISQRIQDQLSTSWAQKQSNVRKLKEGFLESLKSYFLFVGTEFKCQLQEFGGYKSHRKDAYIIANVFGIFIFTNKFKDYPSQVIYYEEIVYVIGYALDLTLFYEQKDIKVEKKIQVFFKTARGRELYEDIISYAILRTLEKNRVVYAINALPEFEERFTNLSSPMKKKKKLELEQDEELLRETIEKKDLILKELAKNQVFPILEPCFIFHEKFNLFLGEQLPKKPVQRIKKDIKKYEKMQLAPEFKGKKKGKQKRDLNQLLGRNLWLKDQQEREDYEQKLQKEIERNKIKRDQDKKNLLAINIKPPHEDEQSNINQYNINENLDINSSTKEQIREKQFQQDNSRADQQKGFDQSEERKIEDSGLDSSRKRAEKKIGILEPQVSKSKKQIQKEKLEQERKLKEDKRKLERERKEKLENEKKEKKEQLEREKKQKREQLEKEKKDKQMKNSKIGKNQQTVNEKSNKDQEIKKKENEESESFQYDSNIKKNEKKEQDEEEQNQLEIKEKSNEAQREIKNYEQQELEIKEKQTNDKEKYQRADILEEGKMPIPNIEIPSSQTKMKQINLDDKSDKSESQQSKASKKIRNMKNIAKLGIDLKPPPKKNQSPVTKNDQTVNKDDSASVKNLKEDQQTKNEQNIEEQKSEIRKPPVPNFSKDGFKGLVKKPVSKRPDEKKDISPNKEEKYLEDDKSEDKKSELSAEKEKKIYKAFAGRIPPPPRKKPPDQTNQKADFNYIQEQQRPKLEKSPGVEQKTEQNLESQNKKDGQN